MKKAHCMDTRKLNLGSGDVPLEGYENWDRKTGQEIFPLDVPDGSITEIRASHVLEHFSHRMTQEVVNHWVSKLQPGGLLKVAVPDFASLAAAYVTNDRLPIEGFVMGGHVDQDDLHGAIFDVNMLCAIFRNAGLERVKAWESDHEDCSSMAISLNLMGYKPAADKMEFKGVRACLASARYGPALHHRCIYEALTRLSMRIHTITGFMWHQSLSEAMEAEIADPETRYILTLDYDTIFTHEEVIELYRIMETHPHIDALVSLQSKRGGSEALFTMADDAGNLIGKIHPSTFDALTAPIHTGHFGLTLLRADKLREFPRPWMTPKPNADGRWGDGRTDPDIAFWQNWKTAGNTTHLACKVAVGHLEEMIMWPGTDFGAVYQKSADYMNHGKPLEAR
jgi:predicted SAM-dependent methyltransferase